MGRTSTRSPPGHDLAIASASSRSFTSTIAKPPMTSFDSMNGPSVTVTLPFLRATVVAVLGPLQLLAADDPARLAVLLEPLVDLRVRGRAPQPRASSPSCSCVFHRVREHQDVLHSGPPFWAVLIAASLIRRTGAADFDRLLRSR